MSQTPGELEVVGLSDTGAALGGLTPGSGEEDGAIVGRSLTQIAWRRLKRDKLALASGAVVLLFVLVAILAPVLQHLMGQDYTALNNTPPNDMLNPETSMPLGSFGGMSAQHWFGVTPLQGQDIASMLMFGARTSLIVGVAATGLSLLLGIPLGIVAGYYRGWTDNIISRVMDVLLSFPVLLLSISLIAVVALISTATWVRFAVLIFVLGFFGFPYIGRIVRGQVLSLREKEFVDASRSLGASSLRIMAREIAPNLIGPVLVYTTLTIPNNILGEAGLSFLGVGLQPPTVSWGQMLSDAGNFFQIDPMYLVFPGLALFITVMAFNLFGDGLRDALDPKSTR